MSNLRIIINDDILFTASSCADTIFYIEYEGLSFPDNQWTDLTSSVLSMWTYKLVENTRKHKARFELFFLDGPYKLDVEKEHNNLHIDCVNFRKDKVVEFTIDCRYCDFLIVVREAIKSLDNALHKAWRDDNSNKEVCQMLFKDCRFLTTEIDNALSNCET